MEDECGKFLTLFCRPTSTKLVLHSSIARMSVHPYVEGARQFVDDNCGDDCDGQVKRVAARFGLIGEAGELSNSVTDSGGTRLAGTR